MVGTEQARSSYNIFLKAIHKFLQNFQVTSALPHQAAKQHCLIWVGYRATFSQRISGRNLLN